MKSFLYCQNYFSTVIKGKEVKLENSIKEAPLLAELQIALADPANFLSQKEEKKAKIVELVTELETKANEIKDRIDQPKSNTTDLEKRFLKLYNRLQNDFQTLKKYVESNQTGSTGYGGSGGSGEVRILRMDDVEKTTLPEDGDTLVWDFGTKKFRLENLRTLNNIASPLIGGSTTFQYRATVSGAFQIKYPLTVNQYSANYNLYINGLLQSKKFYRVDSSGIFVFDSLSIESGDLIDFMHKN